MKLYYSPGACSLAPHILIKETGLDCELIKVSTKTHSVHTENDFYAINPKGYVPFLQLDNGEFMSEGPVICQYLCDLARREDLMPAAGTLARYRVMEWQGYINSEIHKSFSPLFNSAFGTDAKALHTTLLEKKLAWVSSQLGQSTFLTGSTFTAADAYLFVVVNWAKVVNVSIEGLSELAAFQQAVRTRPAVQAALQAEGLKS
jgi:glutathione S-transferase